MGEMRNAQKNLVIKAEGKKPLGRRKCRREDNIKGDLKIEYNSVWLNHSVWDPLACSCDMVMNFQIRWEYFLRTVSIFRIRKNTTGSLFGLN
jgi:hypothetical protein